MREKGHSALTSKYLVTKRILRAVFAADCLLVREKCAISLNWFRNFLHQVVLRASCRHPHHPKGQRKARDVKGNAE